MTIELTRRELAFIDEYFICGLRGADAARRLGSKQPRQYAHRMLTNDNILAEIDHRLAEKKMSANEVLARLSDMAMSNIADFANIEDSSDLKKYRYKTHVIKKFKKKVMTTKAGDRIVDFELELYGADSALVNLGRHYKLFTDKVEHSGLVEVVNVSDSDIIREFAQLLNAARERATQATDADS